MIVTAPPVPVLFALVFAVKLLVFTVDVIEPVPLAKETLVACRTFVPVESAPEPPAVKLMELVPIPPINCPKVMVPLVPPAVRVMFEAWVRG